MSAVWRTRRASLLVGVALAVLGALGLVGCNRAGPATELTAYADFSDVNQLVGGAPVDMADIPVGRVTGITLHGAQARVQMVIDRSADVPADVSAQLDQTSVLGDYYVALVAPKDGSSTPLESGTVIERTSVRPEIEQLVQAGSQVFGSIPNTELAEIIQAGGEGFGGQSATLRQLLNDFSDVTAGYATRTAEIQTLIGNLDQLSSGLAPAANQDAQAITNLSQTVGVLAQQSNQFITLLQALDNLSIEGHSLVGQYLPQIYDELTSLGATSATLAAHQRDIAGLIETLPGYNTAANAATVHDFIQVFEDVIICGVPGGGENDNDAAATCAPTGPPKS